MGNNNITKEEEFIEDPKDIRKKLKNLEETEETTESIKEKVCLFEKLFEFENTNEKDIFQYMISYLELYKRNEKTKKEFDMKLKIYQQGISDQHYTDFFYEYPRINSKEKIFNLFKLICKDLKEDVSHKKKEEFINEFNALIKKEEETKFIFKNVVDWGNEELYSYNLYLNLLDSLDQKINYYMEAENLKLKNNILYQEYEELLNKTKDEFEKENILKKMKHLNLFGGIFFKKYIKYFSRFLSRIKINLDIRFKVNNLREEKDQLLFEDFIQLLCIYSFKGNEERLIQLWNQAFVPLTLERKLLIVENKNKSNEIGYGLIKFELTKNDELNIIENGKIVYTFPNISNYDLITFLEDLSRDKRKEVYDYYLNKNLIPGSNYSELFVIKNELAWRNLLTNILSSQAIKECVSSVFHVNEEINDLYNIANLNKIIKRIRFFIYEADISGCINENSLRIYEYGLFIKDENKSISLLLFYSINIITNINEIFGHLFIRNYSLNNYKKKVSLDSQNIKEKDYSLYTNYSKRRKKEFREAIEIALFGKRIRELTIKEALFIIDPSNYFKGLNYFNENFKKCNEKKIQEIITPISNITLTLLGIDIDDLSESNDIKCNLENSQNNNIFLQKEVLMHPPEFYYGKLDSKALDEMLLYMDLIQEDMKNMK